MIYLHPYMGPDVGKDHESDVYVRPENGYVTLQQGTQSDVPDLIVVTSRNDLEQLIKVLSELDVDEIFPEEGGETNVTQNMES